METEAQVFSGGFAAPVLASQSVFRVVMEALARPARILSLTTDAEAPAPACPAIAALALTLADADTPVWLSPSLEGSAFARWLAFQTGAPLVRERIEAMFAFAAEADGFPDMSGFSLGSDLYPDRSATLVIEIEALHGGRPMRAEGPGIEGVQTLAPRGLPAGFLEERTLNRSLYPRGIDLILVSGCALIGLPRTTRLMPAEG